jgi:hypothetical protein
VCSLFKNNGPKIDYAEQGVSMLKYFHTVSNSTQVIGMLTYVSEATALRQNWSSGRCNVSWLHIHQHGSQRKIISGYRVDQNEGGSRISTVRLTTHFNKLQATDPIFTKKRS